MRRLSFFGALSALALLATLGCGEAFDAGTSTGGSSASSSASTAAGMGGDAGSMGVKCPIVEETLAFKQPVTIAVNGPGFSESHPRSREENGKERLAFVTIVNVDDHDIAHTLGPGPWADGQLSPKPGINTDSYESGPLLLPDTVSLPNVDPGAMLFDARDTASGTPRRIFWSTSYDGTTRTLVDSINDGMQSYSVAVAYEQSPVRYWYMSQTNSGINLVTKAEGGSPVPVNLVLPGSCAAQGQDLAPWVTPKGDYLFFSSGYNPAGICATPTQMRAFYVKLEPTTGQPADVVKLVYPVETSNSQTPSLSPDQCTLYFSSDLSGVWSLYSAGRQ